jgi:hypothetical protein
MLTLLAYVSIGNREAVVRYPGHCWKSLESGQVPWSFLNDTQSF